MLYRLYDGLGYTNPFVFKRNTIKMFQIIKQHIKTLCYEFIVTSFPN